VTTASRFSSEEQFDGSLPDEMIIDMVEDSYDLVVSKLLPSRRQALGWGPSRSACDDLEVEPRESHSSLDRP
jgi:hypothetical protein